MKIFLAALLFSGVWGINPACAQHFINKASFFSDTAMVNSSLSVDMKKLMVHKDIEGKIFPAVFSCKIGDSIRVNEPINIEVRGHFRRGYCYLPPLKLIYKQNPSGAFYNFKDLKMVSACMPTRSDDQNLLKEFLIYKLYNLLTEKSFRVRLLNMNYLDSAGKKKPITEHAFLVEDIKDLAKRNACKEMKDAKFAAAATERRQMTIAAVFEYMIGNTDWSVPGGHNIRLIKLKDDALSRPLVVPYDFDFSGLVNSPYAAPDERLGLENVRQRLYRGLPGTTEELSPVFELFNKQKESIYAVINNFKLLSPASKKEMTHYIDGFYETINNPAEMKKAFMAAN